MVSVALPGPPPVMMNSVSNSRSASMPRMTRATRMSGRRSGSVRLLKRCQALAPSTAAASNSSDGSDCMPARNTRNMNGVLPHIHRHDRDERELRIALTAYAGWLQAGGNNKQSVASWLRGIRALMSRAELRGYLELSPFRAASARATFDGMVALAGRQLANPLRDTAIILLLFDTGIRRSEVCRLRLADVIEGAHMANSVTVRGKGDKYRRIEIRPQTQRAVFEYLVNERPQRVRSEALFLGRGAHGWRGSHPLTVDGVSQIVERIARRAGVEGSRLGPHSLRHGFTQEYLESEGARIEDLQVLLGHESIAAA